MNLFGETNAIADEMQDPNSEIWMAIREIEKGNIMTGPGRGPGAQGILEGWLEKKRLRGIIDLAKELRYKQDLHDALQSLADEWNRIQPEGVYKGQVEGVEPFEDGDEDGLLSPTIWV